MAATRAKVSVRSRFPEIIAKLDSEESRVALTRASQAVVDLAKGRAPVSPGGGALRDSIEAKPYRGEAVGIYMLFYGMFVEHGTVNNQPPHPFLVPAAEAGKDDVARTFSLWLKTL